jgi:hypothetical protein
MNPQNAEWKGAVSKGTALFFCPGSAETRIKIGTLLKKPGINWKKSDFKIIFHGKYA